MIFPREFIKLQFDFAQKVSKVLKIPIDKALFEYSCMPVRIGVPFSNMVEDNPAWQKFIEYLGNERTYQKAYEYYLKVNGDVSPMRPQYGCFSFDYIESEKAVKIHFANNDSSEPGVLSDERIQQRLEELKEMFIIIKKKYPKAIEVVSSSWLYNVEKFKRLFPKVFFKHATIKTDYRSLGLWGQFVNKYGINKEELVENFLLNLLKAQNIEDINNCFPLKNLKVYADITDFYKFLVIN